MLQQVLEHAKAVSQQAEVFHLSGWSRPVVFEANRLKSLVGRDSSGMALRLIKDGRVGFSSTTHWDGAETLVDNALETVPFGPKAAMDFPGPSDFTAVPLYDPAVESQSLEDMIQLGQRLIDGVRDVEPDLLCDASVSRSVSTLRLLNSNGASAEYTRSGFSAYVGGALIKGTDMLFLGDGDRSCSPISDPAPLVSSVLTQLERGRDIASPTSGDLPVVFTPRGVGGALLSPLLAGFNGKSILQGSSPLVGKLGEQLLDERFSLWDDPTMAMKPGSRMCDDEGVPSSRMPLIENGVIRNFLYDLQTAGQAGAQSTGSAHRGLNSLPSPGVSVGVVASGDVAFDDMIADIQDGIVVERLLGAGQSNILGGDFNANVLLGYRIEEGNVVGRVKNTVISGNVYTALKNVQAIGRESQWVGGSLRAPALYLDAVSVATKE
jgi:PmbA protein